MKEACFAVGILLGNGAKHLRIDADSQLGPANSCRTHAQSSHVVSSSWHARATCEGCDGQWETWTRNTVTRLLRTTPALCRGIFEFTGRFVCLGILVYSMLNFSQQLHRLPALCLLNPHCCCLLGGTMCKNNEETVVSDKEQDSNMWNGVLSLITDYHTEPLNTNLSWRRRIGPYCSELQVCGGLCVCGTVCAVRAPLVFCLRTGSVWAVRASLTLLSEEALNSKIEGFRLCSVSSWECVSTRH